jgi:hypothetical protein
MAKQIPLSPDFTDFLRDLGQKSLDHFASRFTTEEGAGSRATPLSGIADRWMGLTEEQKTNFVDQVIAAATLVIAAAPAATAIVSTVKRAKKRSDAKAAAKKAPEKKKSAAAKGGSTSKKTPKKGKAPSKKRAK